MKVMVPRYREAKTAKLRREIPVREPMEQEIGDDAAARLAVGLRPPRPDQLLPRVLDFEETHLDHQSEVARDVGRGIHDQLSGGG